MRNVSLDNLSRGIVKRERTSPAPGGSAVESVSAVAGPSGTTEGIDGATQVITISRADGAGDDGDEDEDMSEDEDEGLAEMAAREGMSLQEYREKIDRQMQEMNTIQAEAADVRFSPSLCWPLFSYSSCTPLGISCPCPSRSTFS